jgi:hypothetical protein
VGMSEPAVFGSGDEQPAPSDPFARDPDRPARARSARPDG